MDKRGKVKKERKKKKKKKKSKTMKKIQEIYQTRLKSNLSKGKGVKN